jgi:diguanylate cyclase (GGDEF)-like protein
VSGVAERPIAVRLTRRLAVGASDEEIYRARRVSCLVLLALFAPLGVVSSLAVGASDFLSPRSLAGLATAIAAAAIAIGTRTAAEQHRWTWFVIVAAGAQALGISQLGNDGVVLLPQICLLGFWVALYFPTDVVRSALVCACAAITVVVFAADNKVVAVLAVLVAQVTIVTGTLIAHAAVLALRAANEELDDARRLAQLLATTDSLTGAHNRRSFTDLVRSVAAGPAGDHALLIVDIDNFKVLNDLHGHLVGDEVLRVVASRLTDALPDARVARWGGEEFAILRGPITAAESVLHAAEQLRLRVAGAPMATHAGELFCTVSVGATIWSSATPFEAAMRRADSGLYDAKAGGRNCVRVRAASRPAGAEPRSG